MNVINLIKVGIADLNTVNAPGVLRTTGLGSCVGVALYDDMKKVAGLAHVMLPSSEMMKYQEGNKMKYANTAIPLLIESMISLGAKEARIVAKLAGGAQMFQFSGAMESVRIGPRNIEACREILQVLKISIIAEDTGGNFGRTIELNADTGRLIVKTINQGVKEL